MRSFLREPFSPTSTSQLIAERPTGTRLSQPIALASPAARGTINGARESEIPSALADASTSMLFCIVFLRVNSARNRSPSRTSGASPEKIIRSCVDWIDAEPVPKRPWPPVATAAILKPVIESLRGISTEASPFPSSGTRPFHRRSVSKSSRVICRPPPPPEGKAFNP